MRGRPGRTAIPVLAVGFVLMLFSAGVAVAGPEDNRGPSRDGGHGGGEVVSGDHGSPGKGDAAEHAGDHEHGDGGNGGVSSDNSGNGGSGDNNGNNGNDGSGGNSGPGGSGGGGVSGQSDGGTGGPTTPVPTVPPVPAVPAVAPAVAPVVADIAPDAPQVDAAAVTAGDAGGPAAADAAAAALPDLSGLGALAAPAPVADASSGGFLPAAREVLSTPEARSLAAVLAIALGALLFLALQGLFDRGEPKLAGVRDERDVARFR